MSVLGDTIGRGGEDGSSPTRSPALQSTLVAPLAVTDTPPASSIPPGSSPAPSTSQDGGRSDLSRRRDALAEQVTELHWDLGGLTYEMAIRDHFRLDVLVRRAAVLQERDAELAEIERLLRLEEGASIGACPHCAAPHSRGALFCWQCGVTLMERAPAQAVLSPEAVSSAGHEAGDYTEVLNALLTPPHAE